MHRRKRYPKSGAGLVRLVPYCYYIKVGIAMDNNTCGTKILKRDVQGHLYHGETDLVITEQYFYSVNWQVLWVGILDDRTYRRYHQIEICMEDTETGKEYVFGDHVQRRKAIIPYTQADDPLGLFAGMNSIGKASIEIKLPEQINLEALRVKWVHPDYCSKPLLYTLDEIKSIYGEELEQISSILKQYCNIGIQLDVDRELKAFERAPDFIKECSEVLKKCLNEKRVFDERATEAAKIMLTFRVDATYDKKYYCAAKLADSAYDVKSNEDENEYYVTFNGSQLEEISLMLRNLTTPFNTDREDLSAASTHLSKYDYYTFLEKTLFSTICVLRGQYGYYSFVAVSVLDSIVKILRKNERKKLHDLYNAMAKENRITTRWSNEYKLFMIVSKLVKDAVYQYRTEWLGQQSFDIFIPSQNIAIEYQGQQHYEAIDLFGGEEALEDNMKRDIRKRELSVEHGVTVLNWKYSVPVNQKNVLSFFSEHGVAFSRSYDIPETGSSYIQMAPVQLPKPKAEPLKKPTVERVSPFVIRQFDANGKFIAEYDSMQQAVTASGVSEKSILNTIYGARKTGGGYIWLRCQRNSDVIDTTPTKRLENTGLAKRILQFSKDGEFIAEHVSIGQAAKKTGVNKRSISDALSGVQKTAGGYVWRYADEGQPL